MNLLLNFLRIFKFSSFGHWMFPSRKFALGPRRKTRVIMKCTIHTVHKIGVSCHTVVVRPQDRNRREESAACSPAVARTGIYCKSQPRVFCRFGARPAVKFTGQCTVLYIRWASSRRRGTWRCVLGFGAGLAKPGQQQTQRDMVLWIGIRGRGHGTWQITVVMGRYGSHAAAESNHAL